MTRPPSRSIDRVVFPADPLPDTVDVLVVGAGPSGLASAVDVELHGLRVAVIDRGSEATLVRAGAAGYSARVVEHLRRWGVLDGVRSGWTIPPEWNRGITVRTSLVGHDLGPTDRARRDRHSPEDALRRPQTVLQQSFLDRLAGTDATISAGWSLTGLDDRGDHVLAEVAAADGATRTIRARFVIGADGSRSTVRTLVGIHRTGEYATERHFRFVVRTRRSARELFGAALSGTNLVYNAGYSGFLAAISEYEWRAYTGPYPLDEAPSEAELLALAEAAFGIPVEAEIASVSPYFRSTRIADRFRRGNVFLVGDAAHIRPPGGNLGEGFGDVANLGWKLAAVLRGDGADALLESYDLERRPHVARVAAYAEHRARDGDDRLIRLRQLDIPDDAALDAEAASARVRMGEILGAGRRPNVGVVFDERYDASPVISGAGSPDAWDPHVYRDDPRPGHRAPDVALDPYGSTLHDRLRTTLTLLVLDPAATAVADRVRKRDLRVEVLDLPDPDATRLYPYPAVLLRPDAHVAWVDDGTVDIDVALDLAYGRHQLVGAP